MFHSVALFFHSPFLLLRKTRRPAPQWWSVYRGLPLRYRYKILPPTRNFLLERTDTMANQDDGASGHVIFHSKTKRRGCSDDATDRAVVSDSGTHTRALCTLSSSHLFLHFSFFLVFTVPNFPLVVRPPSPVSLEREKKREVGWGKKKKEIGEGLENSRRG